MRRGDFPGLIQSTDSVFLQYPGISVKEEFARLLYNGNPLKTDWILDWEKQCQSKMMRVYDSMQSFVGIYRWDDLRMELRPVKIFMETEHTQ